MADKKKQCPICEGSGYLQRTPKQSNKSLVKCLKCDGEGYIPSHSSPSEPHKISICEDCKIQIVCAIKTLGKKECDLYTTETNPQPSPQPSLEEAIDSIVCALWHRHTTMEAALKEIMAAITASQPKQGQWEVSVAALYEHEKQLVSEAIKQFTETLNWIAEHLTHLHLNAIGDRMDIDYIDDKGHTQHYEYNDSEYNEDYPEMLVKAVAHIRAMAKEGK